MSRLWSFFFSSFQGGKICSACVLSHNRHTTNSRSTRLLFSRPSLSLSTRTVASWHATLPGSRLQWRGLVFIPIHDTRDRTTWPRGRVASRRCAFRAEDDGVSRGHVFQGHAACSPLPYPPVGSSRRRCGAFSLFVLCFHYSRHSFNLFVFSQTWIPSLW